jgi:hypothetical protein
MHAACVAPYMIINISEMHACVRALANIYHHHHHHHHHHHDNDSTACLAYSACLLCYPRCDQTPVLVLVPGAVPVCRSQNSESFSFCRTDGAAPSTGTCQCIHIHTVHKHHHHRFSLSIDPQFSDTRKLNTGKNRNGESAMHG